MSYDNRGHFHLSSRDGDEAPFEEKHERLMQAMAGHSRPWGLQDLPLPAPPALAPADLSANLSLTRTLKSPVRYANISYARRNGPQRHLYCDFIHVDFTWVKVSDTQFKALIRQVIPDYLLAFDADDFRVAPLQPYLDYVWEVGRRESYGPTTIRGRAVPCICPVNFWSDSRCQAAFGRSSQEIARLLTQENVETSRIGDGVYVIFADTTIANENALQYELEFRQLLTHQ